MKKLSFLIHSLTKEETDVVVKYYLLKNGYSKRLKLFNLIQLEGVENDLDASKRLYNAKPNAAYCQLKKRLNEDILNLLVAFDYQTEEPKDFISAEARATKYVLQAKTLFKKGVNQEAIILIKKAFALTEEHEAYEVQALAHAVLKAYSDDSVLSEVQDLERKFSKNVDTLYQLINLRLDRKVIISTTKSKYDSMSGNVETLEKGSDEHSAESLRLKFLYTTQALEKFLEEKEYTQSLKLTENILPVIEDGDHVLTASQKAMFYLNLSKVFLGLYQYKKALVFGEKALGLFASFEDGKTEAFKLIYKSHFYLNDLSKAREVLNVCIKTTGREIDELLLFQAYHFFSEKNHKTSLKAVNGFLKLSGLHVSLALNGKLLELLNLLEMQDYEWFEYKLENFRKVVYYHGETGISERFSLICKAFFSLKKLSYSRSKLRNQIDTGWFDRLSEKNGNCTWDPLGAELVPVHHWLMN